MPPVWELARRSEEHLKGMVLPGTLFEELGFNYIGPMDGHDVRALRHARCATCKKLRGPQFLHVVTRKGKGYAPAEADPIKWHGPGPFDPASGTIFKEKAAPARPTRRSSASGCATWPSATRASSASLPRCARARDSWSSRSASPTATSTSRSPSSTPSRSPRDSPCEGLKPVVAIYSTFLQRAYDQLIHDVALQNLPVVFALDRAGLVGSDGATHQGSYDLSFLRCIPNMVIMAPADENECRQMLYTATTLAWPSRRCAIRAAPAPACRSTKEFTALPVGRAQLRREGRSGLALLAFGPCWSRRTRSRSGWMPRWSTCASSSRSMRTLVLELAGRHRAIVTLEENAVQGGAGSAVAELLAAEGLLRAAAADRHSGPLHRARLARFLPGRRRPGRRRASAPRSSAGGPCSRTTAIRSVGSA